MKATKKHGFLVAVMVVFSVFLLSSCEDTPEEIQLPPAESLIIDWDLFPTQSGTKALKGIDTPMPTYQNWFYSAASVFVWNTAVAANIAIPVVAYRTAFNHDPVYLGDQTWQWTYSVTVNQRTIVAELTGERIDNETFSMEMKLSESEVFEDFTWFQGIIRYDQTRANWTLSHSPDNPVEYLDIVYEKDFENDVYNIRYTVIDPTNDLYNGYLDFGLDASMDMNAHYEIFRSDTTTTIEWSTETHAGRVADQRRYGDSEWHCWDTMLQDVECNDGDLPSLSGKD